MNRTVSLLTSVAACSLIALASSAYAQEQPATYERLINANNEPENWLLPMQNYGANRYSTLNEINRDNIGGLHVAFTVPLNQGLRGRDTADNQSPGLVDAGFMYIEPRSGTLLKIDMTSGDRGLVQWAWDGDLPLDTGGGMRTRGAALYEDSVVVALGDTRVVRIDRNSGEIIWESQIGRRLVPGHSGVEPQSENFTANPLVADGHIMVGNAAGDAGTRGWVAAVNFETGEEEWRFFTVPGPGEPGHETWADEAGVAWMTGGASIWTGWSHDPEQRLFIGGTAQPVPMFDPEYRPGDNLYSNSALALDIDTGDLRWYFQYTPNESWDYDEQGVHMLIDAPFDGEDRQMVAHFGRNGFFYELDRTDGAFISAQQYVSEVTWTAGIDPKTGHPVEYDPNLTLQTYIPETRWARADTEAKRACPYLPGGVRWQPPSYDRDRMVAYVAGEDGCQVHMIMPAIWNADANEIDEQGRRAPNTRDDEFKGGLIAAIDITTGELINSVTTEFANRSGALTTAGGLLLTATNEGAVRVFDSETLEELWTFHTGIGIKAPMTTFEINGKQYFAIVAGAIQDSTPATLGVRGWGDMLYVFTL